MLQSSKVMSISHFIMAALLSLIRSPLLFYSSVAFFSRTRSDPASDLSAHTPCPFSRCASLWLQIIRIPSKMGQNPHFFLLTNDSHFGFAFVFLATAGEFCAKLNTNWIASTSSILSTWPVKVIFLTSHRKHETHIQRVHILHVPVAPFVKRNPFKILQVFLRIKKNCRGRHI